MGRLEDWKGRASGYLKDAGKRTEEFADRAAQLKTEYDETKRKKLEAWIYRKEAELKKLEKDLISRDKILREKERKFSKININRRLGFIALTTVIVFFGIASYKFSLIDHDQPVAKPLSENTQYQSGTEIETPPRKESKPYKSQEKPLTSREKAIYDMVQDLKSMSPGFDVGNYCLAKERSGHVTFDECLGVAMSAAANQMSDH
ncbi:hypothetical protein LL273_13980 [Marinobacter salarius]|uniref:hypothetical protein n=1 Tax=Marinobacter salarius TaxID=1420917 RepID=UPI001D18745C|nr:hypothetical protein [Marinobacter salarius]MCC4284835.1 hypothetical protein [Marinobacter salarius]